MKRAFFLFTLVGIAVGVPAIVSCADSDDDGAAPEADASSEADAPVTPPDAGCDAADGACGPKPLDCSATDFCPVTSPVDPRFALTAIWGSSANDVWAVGSGGTVVHFDGTTWKLVPSGIPDTFHAVWGSGPNDVWMGSSCSTLYHLAGPTGALEQRPAFAGPGEVYPGRVYTIWGAGSDVRVGAQLFGQFDEDAGDIVFGTHLRSVGPDAGGGWEVARGFDGRFVHGTIRAIWGASSSDVWMAIDNAEEEPWTRGSIVRGRQEDGGAFTWASVESQSSAPLESLWGTATGDVWGVGSNGIVRHFKPNAPAFAIEDANVGKSLHAVSGTSASDVWAVGDDGTIIHFDGTSWSEASVALPLGPKPTLWGVWASAPNDVWVVGDGFILHSTGKKAKP